MSGSGKWSQPGVPHKGWTCIGIVDLEEPFATCEMCEVQRIRYAHSMWHPEYPDILGCGCICAGRMEEDHERSQRREAVFRSASSRRRKWLTRDWHVSRKGNPYLNVDGYNIVIYSLGSGWGYRVTDSNLDTEQGSMVNRIVLASMDAAKLEAFDCMIWMKGMKA